MGGRYLINGTQLGMLIGFLDGGETKEAKDLLEQIQQHQHIWESDVDMVKDVQVLREFIKEMEKHTDDVVSQL